MNPYLLSLARRRTYYLFGRLFLDGLTADLLPLLEAVPELAVLAGDYDPEQAAADHYQLTAVAVFPYESIFLDPSGLLGGPLAAGVGDIYGQVGFSLEGEADHIGQELLFLSYLCTCEADAHIGGDEQMVSLWQSRQQAFLTTHLLAWIGAFSAAVAQSGDAFYSTLAELTLALAADHFIVDAPGGSQGVLPAPPDIAGDESGLKEIARTLVSPPYSGLFLSRGAISAIARSHDLPRGFGSRSQLLTNLLRTAGQYDAAGAVFSDLAALCQRWEQTYEAQILSYPELSPWLRSWQEQVRQTVDSLQEMIARIPGG